jgi:D-aspartate ligase
MSNRPTAVVIGLDSPTGLQTARILARRGVPVIGLAGNARHPCCRTRVCREILNTDIEGPGLVQSLRQLAKRLPERAVLFPCTDLSVLLLSRRRAEVGSRFHLVLPAPDVIEMLVDKGRFTLWAEQHGFAVPRTRILRSATDVVDAAAALRFPCMLKPVVRSPEWKRNTREKAFHVVDAAALHTLFAQCRGWADALIVQEFVEGGDGSHFTCNCYLTRSGEPAVTFTSRKLRQWPLSGGEGCLSEEARNDRVRDETLRLFQRAGHRGLGYVEFKQDARTGEYLILEPNVGRPTGRSAQAEAAGVELIYTQYCDAVGLPLPEAREQHYRGVKWIFFRRDLQSAFYHWRRGQLTFAELLRSWRGRKQDALFSWADPAPFWADLAYCALELLARRRQQSAAVVAEEVVSA